MGQILQQGLLQGRGSVGVEGRAGTGVNNELAVGGFVRWSWVDGSEKRMWKSSLRIH